MITTGTLSGLVLRKPSEVEAAARLPLDILQIILATPLNALINPADADLPEEIHDPSPAINNAEEDGNNDLFKLKCTYSVPKSG